MEIKNSTVHGSATWKWTIICFWNLWPLLGSQMKRINSLFYYCDRYIGVHTQSISRWCTMKSFNSIMLSQPHWFSGVPISVEMEEKKLVQRTILVFSRRTKIKSSALTQLIEQNESVFVIVHCLKSMFCVLCVLYIKYSWIMLHERAPAKTRTH